MPRNTIQAMIYNQTQLLEDLASMAEQHDDIAVLWLYGSRATGSDHEYSDIDLAIAFKQFDLTPADKMARTYELAMEWARQVGIHSDLMSIVDINTIPVYLAFSVIQEGRILYQEDSPRAYKEADRISSQYEYQIIENKYHEH